MSGRDYTDLVRFRNDGEDFHLNWTTRRALRILGDEGLDAIAVEGVSDRDRYKGRRIAAGLLVADTTEYFGGEDVVRATRIVVNQLKYSTRRPDDPWAWSDVAPVLKGFAERFRAIARRVGVRAARAKLRFRFVTNRPVSANVLAAVEALTAQRPGRLRGHSLKVARAMPKATGLNGRSLAAFLTLVDLGRRADTRERIAARADVEAGGLLPSMVRGPVTPLRDLVRRLGTTTHADDPTIRRETVLQAFGIDDPGRLFPAPAEFEALPAPVARTQEKGLVETVRRACVPVLVTATGGTGKSIAAQRLPTLLPPGSEAVVFDGFAGGRYRDPSERRHQHRVGLVQIANELAGRGLCDVLLPIQASDRDYVVSFRERLRQAAAVVGARSPDALVVVVVDAADNSVFAGGLYREDAFVSSLMAEPPPDGCRIVAMARPERVEGLHADRTLTFRLAGFGLEETATLVRRFDPGAPTPRIAEFRRLTFANPRVQANQLALSRSLEAAIAQLGPGGLTVEGLITGQLERALEDVRTAQPEADLDALCVGLAALPPMVPIRILAAVSGSGPDRIASFASDFGGGRPLMLREDAIQFRDEPVEKWFGDRFVHDEVAAGRFADRLGPLARSDAYAALALPQLMLRAGRHTSLMDLALADDPGFDDRPVERHAVVLQRVRFGLRSALALGDLAGVAKLFVRAGEQIATIERQERFLEDNADLVPLLSSPEVAQDFVHRRRGGDWFGSVNCYKAELLSVAPETREEARGFLHLAHRWLAEWARRRRTRDPDDWHVPDDELHADDIGAMQFATCLSEGAAAGAELAEGFRPGSLRFALTRVCTTKLLDAGSGEVVQALLGELRSGEPRAAAHLSLRQRGAAAPRREIERTLDALQDVEMPDGPFGYDDSAYADALLTVAEDAASHGLVQQALSLLDRGNWSLSGYPLPDVGGRVVRAMRWTALRGVLRGSTPTVEELWREAHRRFQGERDPGPIRPEFREIHDRLLPTFELRAKVLAGKPTSVDAELQRIAGTRPMVGFDSWQEREFRGERMLAEVDLLRRAGLLDADRLRECERWATRGKPLWLRECLALIEMLTPVEPLHGELIRLGSAAAVTGEDAHDDAETRTGNLASLARALLPISRDESAVYFRRALEDADRVGEELHERLQMLLSMGGATAGVPDIAELGYRILRLAEAYGQINSHKFPWEQVFRTLAGMHPPTAIAAASRLDSRDRVWIGTSLPEVGEVLLQRGEIDIRDAAALHAFGGIWDIADLPARLAELDPPLRERVATTFLRDMVDERRDAWHMRAFVDAAESVSAVPTDVRAAFERRRRRDERSSGSYAANPAVAYDERITLDGRDLLDPVDLAEIVRRARSAGAFSAPLYGLGEAMRAGVRVADRLAHLRALAASDVDMEELLGLLTQAAAAWAPSVAVAQALRDAALELIDRRPFDLLGWRWKRSNELLRELTREEQSVLTRRLVAAIGPGIDDLGSSSLFWLARRVHGDVLTSGDRVDALEFSLRQFEAILSLEEPDGPWREALRPCPDARTALGAMIWTSLGDPSPRRRWRAAHCVRRLAELGGGGLLQTVLARLSEPDPGASIDQRLVFYSEHARTHLLMTVARIARDHPEAVASAIPALRIFSARFHRHVAQRHWAAQALLALEAGGHLAIDAAERERLLLPLAADPAAPPSPAPPVDEEDGDRAYRFPIDFGRREADPIARAFDIAPGELRRRVERAIRSRLGREPTVAYDQDARSGLGLYHAGRRRGPEIERLATYEAWQGLLYAVGELLDGAAETPDLTSSDAYLLRDRFLSAPPLWLSDRRDPDPLPPFAGVAVQHGDAEWEFSVGPADFEAALLESGDLRLAARWHRHGDWAREDAAVSTALVRPEFAIDLLRACQTSPRRFPTIPMDGGEVDLGFQRMRVIPWVATEELRGGVDDDDPLAGDLGSAFIPGRLMRRAFGMRSSEDRRTWTSAHGAPRLAVRATVWGEPPEDERDERLDGGALLTAPVGQVVGALAACERALIARVRIERYSTRRDDDQEPRTYARYFILDGEGRLSWLGGGRRARSPADRAVG